MSYLFNGTKQKISKGLDLTDAIEAHLGRADVQLNVDNKTWIKIEELVSDIIYLRHRADKLYSPPEDFDKYDMNHLINNIIQSLDDIYTDYGNIVRLLPPSLR